MTPRDPDGGSGETTHGWIIDAYADYDKDAMVLWLWNEGGAHRIEDPRFVPTFFLHAPPGELPAIRRRIEILDGVQEVREASHRIALEDDEPRSVLEIVPRHYRDLQRVARILDSNGGYVDHRLFNVDVRFSQRYAIEHGIFPMGLVRHANGTWTAEEEHFALEYPLPPLRMTNLDLRVEAPLGIPRMQDRLLGARVDDVELDGSEEDVLRGIGEVVRAKNPDVLLTLDGDAFAMPYLARKAAECGVDLQLGRDRDRFTEKKGKSYFTYGKIVYKPGQYLLRGRLHLDRGHFAYRESDLAGLAELSRLSTLTPQEQARLTPGTAFTAMQVNLVCKSGCLAVWKKNRPEDFKSAEYLLRGDRGGFIFEPEIGLHEGLYELDFFALYPSIMVKYNISPETLNCPCCKTDGRGVPELAHHLCTRRLGLIPQVLKPVVERRRYYKRMKKDPGPIQEIYKERDTILKWLLVTCLDGSTVVPYKVNGVYKISRIGQVVDRYLKTVGEIEPSDVLHVFGPNPDFRLVEKRVRGIIKAPAPNGLLSIRTRGGRDILATHNHRFFVLAGDGKLEEKRADELRVGDFLPEYSSLPLRNEPRESIDILRPLYESLSSTELPCWRIKGDGVVQVVSENYPAILHQALDRGYTYRSAWLWKHGTPIPLQFLPYLQPSEVQSRNALVGRGRRGGGHVGFVSARIRMDPDLAFLFGFYIGDGTGVGRMVRFSIGENEPEIVGKLMNCAQEKFGLIGQVRKEPHTKMFTLQYNSISLVRILQTVFKIGVTADFGKLVIPPIILNGSAAVRYGFLSGLLASDGSVSPARNRARIFSSKREFVESVSLLLMTLGIPHSLASQRLHGFPLYAVEFSGKDILGRGWLKDDHTRRIEKWGNPKRRGGAGIPIRESGLLSLCQDFQATHGLPRAANRSLDARGLRGKLTEIAARNGGVLPPFGDSLARLVKAGLAFRRIESITPVPRRSKYVYCFETECEPHGFVISGGLLVGNSFGYTGYRNARFGRIECHEAINAYARDILVRTMEIAESHGHEVVHGIVDSVWLRPKADADPIEKVREHIAGSIGLPIELEGRYKWIVFLPCKTTGVGALNRYYGLYEHDEFKLRGIELRKHDTPEFINICQEAMLGELSYANDAAEFRERIPRAVNVLRWTAKRVLDRAIPVHQFLLTKSVSRALPEYVVLTATAAALKQMEKRGFSVEPGDSVRYVLLDMRARDSERKVRVAEFLQGDEEVDAWEYVRLLCRSGQTLLAPFGYTEESLAAICKDLSDVTRPAKAAEIEAHESVMGASHSQARGGVGYAHGWNVREPEGEPGEIPDET